ncbi:MAG: hypothetical protein AB7M93_25870 [Candidatus Obscuribacterales bacterium]
MTKAPSSLTTKKKSEIIEAYEELLAKVQQQKQAPPPEEQRKAIERKASVGTATSLSNDQIVRSCAELRLQLGKALDDLETQLSDEYRKFTEVRKAIEAESARLEEIHEITAGADSLAALLAAQKDRKALFEEEMAHQERELEEAIAEKRAQWAKERELYLQQQEEEKKTSQKAREREEEEYRYHTALSRKREEDAYEAKKAALEAELIAKKQTAEKELSDRESFIASQEEELQKLKEEAAAFPARLQAAISEARETTTEQLQKQYAFETELARKGEEGEKRLLEQTIATLKAKITEQEKLIDQLTRKADHASSQVQEIAVRAIDGARASRSQHDLQKALASASSQRDS